MDNNFIFSCPQELLQTLYKLSYLRSQLRKIWDEGVAPQCSLASATELHQLPWSHHISYVNSLGLISWIDSISVVFISRFINRASLAVLLTPLASHRHHHHHQLVGVWCSGICQLLCISSGGTSPPQALQIICLGYLVDTSAALCQFRLWLHLPKHCAC